VIQALGFGDERAHTAIRVSVGRFNTESETHDATDEIVFAAKRLRSILATF